QAEEGDGAGDGVGRNLLAGGQAQAHHLEFGGADDRLRLQGWGLWMGQQADHFTRAGMVQRHGSSPFGAGTRRLDQGKGYVEPAGGAPAGSSGRGALTRASASSPSWRGAADRQPAADHRS